MTFQDYNVTLVLLGLTDTEKWKIFAKVSSITITIYLFDVLSNTAADFKTSNHQQILKS